MLDSSDLPPPKMAKRGGPLSRAAQLRRGRGGKPIQSRTSSSSSTPALKAGRSPLLDSTESTANMQPMMDALRIPLIHLLALGPASEHSLIIKTKAPDDLLNRVLQRVAKKINNGKQWELMDDVYKDLDVWEFPYPSQEQRDKAIQCARDAFKRLRIKARAPEYRNLLSAEEKEKFDAQPEPVSQPAKPASIRAGATPKAADHGKSPTHSSKASDDGTKSTPQTAGKTTKKQDTTLNRIIAGSKTKAKKPAAAAKSAAPPKPKNPLGRPPKVGRPPKAATGKAANNSKIKSAEIIEDSDEDLEMEDLLKPAPAKVAPPPAARKSPASPPVVQPVQRPASKAPSPMQPAQAPKPASKKPASAASARSNVNSDGEIDNAPPRPQKRPAGTPLPPTQKSPVKKARGSEPPPPRQVRAPASKTVPREAPANRGSSNSPPKPSPLGASPPLNATESSRSSLSASPGFLTGTSTSGQSPLDGMSNKARPRYVSSATSAYKRKVNNSDDEGRHSSVRVGNSAPTSGVITGRVQKRPSPSSATMSLARRFKEEYDRYLELRKDAFSTTLSARRRQESAEQVCIMHKQLEAMKAKIELGAH